MTIDSMCGGNPCATEPARPRKPGKGLRIFLGAMAAMPLAVLASTPQTAAKVAPTDSLADSLRTEIRTAPNRAAGSQVEEPGSVRALDKQVIEGRRSGRSEHAAKTPLRRLENPQAYSTVNRRTLDEQVIVNFDDALKNTPGLDKLWEPTGRDGDGASYYSLRGFEAQATVIDGVPGLTSGSLDPANIESIEVIKGPSSTLFGSSLVSYGGLINTVTKKPFYGTGGEATFTTGSFGLSRVTADYNLRLPSERPLALRINTAWHSEESFQDAGFKKTFFVAPSLAYEATDKLSFLVQSEFMQSEATNPTMLFLNRSNPVQYDDFEDIGYDPTQSLTGNDLSIHNPRFQLKGEMRYRFAPRWTSQSVLSRGSMESDGYYSYLWDTFEDKGQFAVYVSDQQGTTHTTDLQQNFLGEFPLGFTRHKALLGFDHYRRESRDQSTGYPWLLDVTPRGEYDFHEIYSDTEVPERSFSRQTVDSLLVSSPRANSHTRQTASSVYASDVVSFGPWVSVLAALRVDYFDTEGEIDDASDDYDQWALSPKVGLVVQPLPDQIALFANYQNGFKNVAPAQVADVGGGNPRSRTFEPEHANQFEAGIKTDWLDGRVSSTVSAYFIAVDNRVMADPDNPNNSIQGGEVQSRGGEIETKLVPWRGLEISGAYSFNESEVISADNTSIWAEAGKRPVDAGAKHLYNLWATYRPPFEALRGFGIGGGLNGASELWILDSEITGRFTLPAYTVFDGSVFYDAPDFSVTLKINNINDDFYYKGYSTINPQKPRNVMAKVAYKF